VTGGDAAAAAAARDEADRVWLREAFALAQAARAAGRHPFGALVVLNGARVARCGNESGAAGAAATDHAELLAARAASQLFNARELAAATLYTSAEPCAMCAGAIYWAGIGRVVYGLSETRLRALTGAHPDNPTLDLPCRQVFQSGQRTIEVLGPWLEDEAEALHHGFWR
jgi:tRNA(Arg) A34 adenosine deaminase TadA